MLFRLLTVVLLAGVAANGALPGAEETRSASLDAEASGIRSQFAATSTPDRPAGPKLATRPGTPAPAPAKPVTLPLTLEPMVLPTAAVIWVLAILVLALATSLIGILARIKRFISGPAAVASARKTRLDRTSEPGSFNILPAIVSLIMAGIFCVEVFYLWRIWRSAGTAETVRAEAGMTNAGENEAREFVALLAGEAGGPASTDRTFTVSIPGADRFLRDHVRFDKIRQKPGPLDLSRTALAVVEIQDALTVAEELRFMNHPILMTYTVPQAPEDAAGSGNLTMKIAVDGLPLPGRIAGFFWRRLSAALTKAAARAGADNLSVAGISPEGIVLTRRATPPSIGVHGSLPPSQQP